MVYACPLCGYAGDYLLIEYDDNKPVGIWCPFCKRSFPMPRKPRKKTRRENEQ